MEDHYSRKYRPQYECDDGYRVSSLLEKDVDNWLHEKRISHIYRPRIPIPETLTPSFMVHNSKNEIVYIEVWENTDGPEYKESMNKKLQVYAKHGLNLIEILPSDFRNLDVVLPEKLLKKGVLISQ